MSNTPWSDGLPPSLSPNPPAAAPEAPGPGDAMAGAAPFKDALDVDDIIKNLVLDRPLKLSMPHEMLAKYSGYEFRYINDIPHEYADAHRKGFRKVDDPDVIALLSNLVAGTDKVGKSFGVSLFARPKQVGDVIRQRHRQQLAGIYAGMNPENKQFSGKYTDNAGRHGGSAASFEGPAFRIRVR